MRYDGTPNVKQRVPAKLPVATVSILLVTGILTGLQFAFPQILLRLCAAGGGFQARVVALRYTLVRPC
jgi:hypothetical protein